MERCGWCSGNDLYTRYHDQEWGVPVFDDQKLFEFLILEGAQAGLSWLTILKKREGYRRAFSGFVPETVARYGPEEIEALLQDPSIVRNRLKVQAAVTNAQSFLETRAEFGTFADYCWRFVGGTPKINRFQTIAEIPAATPESDRFSRDLRQRGFKFVGSTIVYAFMQAIGMVNDHIVTCFRYREVMRPNLSCDELHQRKRRVKGK